MIRPGDGRLEVYADLDGERVYLLESPRWPSYVARAVNVPPARVEVYRVEEGWREVFVGYLDELPAPRRAALLRLWLSAFVEALSTKPSLAREVLR